MRHYFAALVQVVMQDFFLVKRRLALENEVSRQFSSPHLGQVDVFELL